MNEESKKKILRFIPYGLYVIGIYDGKECHGFTGTFFSQCSFKPPRIMMGVRNDSHSLEMLSKGKVFTVNFVSKEDRKILEQFFKPAPPTGNRFGDLVFSQKITKAPILDKAIAYLECNVISITNAGDHSIVVGEVIEAEVRQDTPPLILSDTNWHYGG